MLTSLASHTGFSLLLALKPNDSVLLSSLHMNGSSIVSLATILTIKKAYVTTVNLLLCENHITLFFVIVVKTYFAILRKYTSSFCLSVFCAF